MRVKCLFKRAFSQSLYNKRQHYSGVQLNVDLHCPALPKITLYFYAYLACALCILYFWLISKFLKAPAPQRLGTFVQILGRGDGRFKSILIRSRYDIGFCLNAISTLFATQGCHNGGIYPALPIC